MKLVLAKGHGIARPISMASEDSLAGAHYPEDPYLGCRRGLERLHRLGPPFRRCRTRGGVAPQGIAPGLGAGSE